MTRHRKRHLAAWLSPFLFWALNSGAVGLYLRMENGSALQYESVSAFVAIRNTTGEPLVFGKPKEGGAAVPAQAKLKFLIERKPYQSVIRTDDKDLVRPFTLMPGEVREILVNISDHYDITALGSYFVQAVVEWQGDTYVSNRALLEVVRGIELTKVVAAVPESARIYRTFRLCYWPRKGGESLFLRVDDEETGDNYGLFPLGRVIRVFEPVIKVDSKGSVEVVHQTGNNQFVRSIFEFNKDRVTFLDQKHFRGNPHTGSPR